MAAVAGSSRIDTAAEKLEQLRREVKDTPQAKGADSSSASSTAVAAHENLLVASQSLAQAARTFHFVINMEPTEEDASSCANDLEEAACIYASWAVNFLRATGPAERIMARPTCAEPLSCTRNLLIKVQRQQPIAVSDVVQVETCTDKLRGLAMDGRVAAARALLQHEHLVRDTIRELQESVDEAADGGSACSSFRTAFDFRGGDSDDEANDETEDADEVELVAQVALTSPLLKALDAAAELMNVGTDAARGASPKMAGLLVTCAKALSQQVDNLATSVHMDDAAGVQQYCTSLSRLLEKLCILLIDKLHSTDGSIAELRGCISTGLREAGAAAALLAGDASAASASPASAVSRAPSAVAAPQRAPAREPERGVDAQARGGGAEAGAGNEQALVAPFVSLCIAHSGDDSSPRTSLSFAL